ncbi:MAG: ATP-dependent helicase, partial [Methylococcaceae bacterium]|nr:ATP-dependent helicase [Methylococcaceae bacterium]
MKGRAVAVVSDGSSVLGLGTSQKLAAQFALLPSLKEALAASVKVGSRAADGLKNTLAILKSMLAAPLPTDAVRAFAASDSYQLYLEAEFPNYRDRLDDLDQLAVFAEQYRDLGAFLDAMTLTGDFGGRIDDTTSQSDQDEESTEGKLILSTIHQAKGLEWDAVFVIHCASGMFPSDRSLGERNGIEEERRLFYVATTRARAKLFLTYPLTTGYESVDIRQPSPFLDEIPVGMVEFVRLKRSLPSWAGETVYNKPPARRQSSSKDDN